jgi:hypothetical protein
LKCTAASSIQVSSNDGWEILVLQHPAWEADSDSASISKVDLKGLASKDFQGRHLHQPNGFKKIHGPSHLLSMKIFAGVLMASNLPHRLTSGAGDGGSADSPGPTVDKEPSLSLSIRILDLVFHPLASATQHHAPLGFGLAVPTISMPDFSPTAASLARFQSYNWAPTTPQNAHFCW